MEMEDQYTITDLRHLISRAPSISTDPLLFQPYQPPPPPPQPQPDLFTCHSLRPEPSHQLHNQYETTLMMMGHQQQHQNQVAPFGLDHHQFNSDSITTNNSGGFEVGSARWPRQETLILLEVRSKLDHKFKEANQKGPLWDEVARIMSEEHGYQRSGKKCREKFENLYKYYKKTKEGKAGRQDGRHYRFFRQLEALYGDHHSPSSNNHHHHLMATSSDIQIVENTPHLNHNSLSPQPNNTISTASLSNSTDFDTSSSNYDDEDDDVLNGSTESNGSKGCYNKMIMKKKRGWKVKIKEFIDLQMRKVMEMQEAWVDKMMKSFEEREKERLEREELWRKQDDARIEREHKFWAKERASIEARDLAFMNALAKLTSSGVQWGEPELARLILIRTTMESRFEQCGFSQEVLWEDIAAKMAYFGYERSAIVCKEKWDSINKTLQEKGNHKRKNNGKRSENYGVISSLNNGGGLYIHNNAQINASLNNNGNNCETRLQLNEGSSSSPSSHNSNINVNSTNMMNDSCLRFFLGDGDNNLGWESNYGLKGQQG